MGIILNIHLKNLDKRLSARVFTALLVSMMTYALFDIGCGLIDNDVFLASRFVSSFFNVGFFISSYMVAYLSFFYSECEIGHQWVDDHKKRVISFIPVMIMILLTFLTLKYKFFFYIDEQSNYIKGPLYVVMLLLAYSYIMAIGIINIWLYPMKKYYAKRDVLLTLSSFVIFPLVAGVIQAFYQGISIICFGGTIAMVQVFTKMQESRITLDALTQINNRTKLMQYLELKVNAHMKNSSNNNLYFIMIDIDKFKNINDTYGHLEGDKAIIALANILKLSCNRSPNMLARYGGDEFSIVCEGDDKSLKTLISKINHNLTAYNQTANKPYKIEVSLGCAMFDENMSSIPDLIAKADSKLYQEKYKKKQMR
ncbi:MAG: GGDEF domain-containing protein [Erysipelotrichaceae bacterium]|nr:GGDEF domain-containing protein [Erysipelotrichaceae bacterium]MDY5252957.1 GGDEF domain-containing protein [Erysipelotrichaceae bacterium]